MRSKLFLFAFILCLLGCEEKKTEIVVSSVEIDRTSLEMTIGDTEQLIATVLPAEADQTVEWTSSDPSVATVTEDGLVEAFEKGTADITVRASDKTAVCKVSVSSVKVETVTVTPTELKLVKGEESALTISVLPEDAEYEGVEWSSSDDAVATVSSEGNVKAVAVGTCTIIVKVAGKTATCELEVLGKEVESVTVTPESANLRIGETLQMEAEVAPVDADDKERVWSSSNDAVATVSADGLVTAVAAGYAVVKVSTSNGKEAEAAITVIADPQDGDFFYSDGTWSTELITEKTPIGVIFYVGDPSEDDATLRKEHPECVNGLVVSIDGEYITRWQTNYAKYGKTVSSWVKANTEYFSIESGLGRGDSGTMNDIVGYNNTHAIEAFNAAAENSEWPVDVVLGLPAYREKVNAPENTSGWYVPSPKELSLLYNGMTDNNIADISGGDLWVKHGEMIQDKLLQVSGAISLYLKNKGDGVPCTYWSSSELDKTNACAIFSWQGTVFFNRVKDTQFTNNGLRVRYILAF